MAEKPIIKYFQDEATGLCFAYHYAYYDYCFVPSAFTCVPATPEVLAIIQKQKELDEKMEADLEEARKLHQEEAKSKPKSFFRRIFEAESRKIE